MNLGPQPSFNFHAEGHAFSANFTRPEPRQIEALAASSLPTIGGLGHSHLEDFRVKHLVSFKRAHTHVSGSFQDEKTATTHATTTVEGFNLLDVVTADRITARLTSEHDLKEPEGHIIALGSTFENLKIGGYPVEVRLRHNILLKNKTHKALRDALEPDKKERRIYSTQGGLHLCSLVDQVITDFPGLSPDDKKSGILRIPHFGTIWLATLLSEAGTRTITMLRCELGSPDAGSVTTAQARTNGQTGPPVPNGT
ncbi:MAG TPA: choice-of-anchor P family protein [Candidatus Dormibacteraeota bacterium]|nr:choice-of-anchor P family protein [Candidatus Dormibacteraeota bacterium]